MYPGISQYATLASLYGRGMNPTQQQNPGNSVAVTPTSSPILPSFGPSYVNLGQALTPTSQTQEQPEQQQQAVTPSNSMNDAYNRYMMNLNTGYQGTAGYFGGNYSPTGGQAGADLDIIRATNPALAMKLQNHSAWDSFYDPTQYQPQNTWEGP